MKKILVFGASSKLAQVTIKHFKSDGTELFLSGSDEMKLKTVSDELTTLNPNIKTHLFQLNALEFDRHQELFDKAIDSMGEIDCVFIAHGTLPNQEEVQKSASESIKEFHINCTSFISLCSIAGNYFESKNKGTIAVIASVAGDRGRQSNYIYGSAKGAVALFLQGLRNRLFKSNVNVVTIKPGMVETPMTAHMPKGLLFAKPEPVGKAIYKAIISGKDVAYIPGFWKLIMFIIRNIPEGVFKKLSL